MMGFVTLSDVWNGRIADEDDGLSFTSFLMR